MSHFQRCHKSLGFIVAQQHIYGLWIILQSPIILAQKTELSCKRKTCQTFYRQPCLTPSDVLYPCFTSPTRLIENKKSPILFFFFSFTRLWVQGRSWKEESHLRTAELTETVKATLKLMWWNVPKWALTHQTDFRCMKSEIYHCSQVLFNDC